MAIKVQEKIKSTTKVAKKKLFCRFICTLIPDFVHCRPILFRLREFRCSVACDGAI